MQNLSPKSCKHAYMTAMMYLAETTHICSDLRDLVLPNSKLNWYIDDSSFIRDGAYRAGAVMVDGQGKMILEHIPSFQDLGTKGGVDSLSQVSQQVKGKRVTIYTDSHYVFSTIYVNGTIYQECGFKSAKKKRLKNLEETQEFLVAMHELWPAHQSAKTPGDTGNFQADEAVKAKGKSAKRNMQVAAVLGLALSALQLPSLSPQLK